MIMILVVVIIGFIMSGQYIAIGSLRCSVYCCYDFCICFVQFFY